MRTNADKAAFIIAVLSLLLGFSLAQNERLYQRIQELETQSSSSFHWNIKVPSGPERLHWHLPHTEVWIRPTPIREPLLNQDEVLHRKMKHLYYKMGGESIYR